MNVINKKHHITKKDIVGYGFEDFRRNYNTHTLNETEARGAEDMIPVQVGNVVDLQEFLAGKFKMPEVAKPKPKAKPVHKSDTVDKAQEKMAEELKKSEKVIEIEDDDVEEYSKADLSAMTKDELCTLADDLGVTDFSPSILKKTLINKLWKILE